MRTAVVALLLVLGLAGCGEDDKPEPAKPTAPPSSPPAEVGTVQGTLKMVGGPPAGAEIPVSGTLKIVGPGTNITAPIDESGKYAIQLPPGSYRITATSPSYHDGGLCQTSGQATAVQPGQTVTADVLCGVR